MSGKDNALLPSYVLELVNIGIIIIDKDSNIRYWNRFMETRCHRASEDVSGESLYEVFPEIPKPWMQRKIHGVFSIQTPTFSAWEQRHHIIKLPHTRPFTTETPYMAQNVSILPLENEDSNDPLACIMIEDATDVSYFQTQLNQTLNELEKSNRIDSLTQVSNRGYWEEVLQHEFERAKRHNHGLSLIMFDLDKFKLINDTFGHLGGDCVLIDVAKIVQELLRDNDLLGRYGGEEFGIILPDTDEQGAFEVAERIRKACLNQRIAYGNQFITVTVSLGVANFKDDIESTDELIERADKALYQSKQKGRNQTLLYSD